jgi:glyceraldehyde-3-phosphate dehydrogenase (NAD(P))
MGTRVVRVAVNGCGVIGKRVADAVSLQDDMTVAGVADVVTDYRIRMAVARGHPLFASTAEALEAMRQAGLPVETIDAIRALTGLETDGARSVAKTDATLGVRKDLMAPVRA